MALKTKEWDLLWECCAGLFGKFGEETCSLIKRAINRKLIISCQEKQSLDKSVEMDATGTHERRKALWSGRPGFEFCLSHLLAAWLKVIIISEPQVFICKIG